MCRKLALEERLKLGIESNEFLTARQVLLNHRYFDELKKKPPNSRVLATYKS
jgi:hypothetical protein